MSKLIALVAISMYAAGERVTIQPGEEVVGLHPLEAQELKQSGSVQDVDDKAADEKAAGKSAKQAAADFTGAKKRELEKQAAAAVAAEQAS